MVEPNSSLAQSLRYSRLVKTRLPPVVVGGWWCRQAVEVESKKRAAVDINTRTSSPPWPASQPRLYLPLTPTLGPQTCTLCTSTSHRAQPPLGIVGQLQRMSPALATAPFIQYPTIPIFVRLSQCACVPCAQCPQCAALAGSMLPY